MATGGARGVRSGQDRGAAGKVAKEAVIRVFVILLDILIVVLLEKTTHEPELRSAAVTDGQERAGSNGKGPKPNRQMGDNLRKTIVEETVAACDACGADIDGPVDRERRTTSCSRSRRVDAEECPKCKARGRFPDNIPCSTAFRPSSSTCWSPKCCPCAVPSRSCRRSPASSSPRPRLCFHDASWEEAAVAHLLQRPMSTRPDFGSTVSGSMSWDPDVQVPAPQARARDRPVLQGRPGPRTWAQKRSTVVSLRMENASLKTAMKVLKGRGGERQASFEQVVDVRAQERQEAAGVIEARPAARHSWPRPALEEVEERLEVAEDACSCCVANGSHQDHRDQKRRIVRRGRDCPGPPVAAVSRHRIRVWTHVLHERVHAALAPRPGAFAGNAGQRAGCCPCSSRFGTRSSRTGVCAMPMHPGPEGGPEVAPGSGHRSAVTRFSPSRSAEIAAKLFADGPHVSGLRPLRRLQEAGAPVALHHPVLLSGALSARPSGLRRPQLEGWEWIDRLSTGHC